MLELGGVAGSTTGRVGGRRREDEVAPRNRQLVDTAFRLFGQHGYHKVSLAHIAAEARAAVRTIYAAFGGKAGILAACIASEDARHAAQLRALELNDGDAANGRWLLLARHLCQRLRDPVFAQLELIVLASGNEALAGACDAAGPGQLTELLRREIVAAQGRVGAAADISADEAAELFIALIAGTTRLRLRQLHDTARGEPPQPGTSLERRVTLFLRAAQLAG